MPFLNEDNPKPGQTNNWTKTLIIWIAILGVAIIVASVLPGLKPNDLELSYNDFLDHSAKGNISSTAFKGRRLSGEFRVPYSVKVGGKDIIYQNYHLAIPYDDPQLPNLLRENGVKVTTIPEGDDFINMMIRFLPWLLLIAFYFFFMRQIRGSQKGIFAFGKSRGAVAQLTKQKDFCRCCRLR